MCEIIGNVTGPIPDRAATIVKGISPDADAVGVIISGLDRVPVHKPSTVVAWRICRRPVIASNSQGDPRSTACNDDRLAEGRCNRDIVCSIQKTILITLCTGYRHAVHRRRQGINLIVFSLIIRAIITGEVGVSSGQRKPAAIIFRIVVRREGPSPDGLVVICLAGAHCIVERPIVTRDVGTGEYIRTTHTRVSTNRLRENQCYRRVITDLELCIRHSEVVYRRCRGVHLDAGVVRHRAVCEIIGNVTGPIPDRAATIVKGISPDADAVGVIISGLDRVPVHKPSTVVAWRICRRPVIASNSQGDPRSTACNDDRLAEGRCNRDIVCSIQKTILITLCTGYRHAV